MRLSISVAILALLVPGVGAEEISHCSLEVEGTIYLDGPCNFESDEDGSFTIGTGDRAHASPHFAYVFLDGASATGYWNGSPAGNHAHDPLGELERDGPCWFNDTARICAIR